MRKLFATAALAAITAAGCHMCDCPYDYCGPVVENHYGPAGASVDEEGYSSVRAPHAAQPQMAGNGPELNSSPGASVGWVPSGASSR